MNRIRLSILLPFFFILLACTGYLSALPSNQTAALFLEKSAREKAEEAEKNLKKAEQGVKEAALKVLETGMEVGKAEERLVDAGKILKEARGNLGKLEKASVFKDWGGNRLARNKALEEQKKIIEKVKEVVDRRMEELNLANKKLEEVQENLEKKNAEKIEAQTIKLMADSTWRSEVKAADKESDQTGKEKYTSATSGVDKDEVETDGKAAEMETEEFSDAVAKDIAETKKQLERINELQRSLSAVQNVPKADVPPTAEETDEKEPIYDTVRISNATEELKEQLKLLEKGNDTEKQKRLENVELAEGALKQVLKEEDEKMKDTFMPPEANGIKYAAEALLEQAGRISEAAVIVDFTPPKAGKFEAEIDLEMAKEFLRNAQARGAGKEEILVLEKIVQKKELEARRDYIARTTAEATTVATAVFPTLPDSETPPSYGAGKGGGDPGSSALTTGTSTPGSAATSTITQKVIGEELNTIFPSGVTLPNGVPITSETNLD